MDSSDDSKKSFFKHVFNFDNDTKSELLNIVQYAIMSIIPVVLVNKGIANYVPEADDNKNTLELIAEIIIQIVVMFLGLFMIDRIITYFPTYSGEKYPDHSIIFMILSTSSMEGNSNNTGCLRSHISSILSLDAWSISYISKSSLVFK